MYCASQNRPVNGAAYMLANMERIIETPNAPILLGGLVTMLYNTIGLRRPMLGSAPLYGIKPMDIAFCFNTSMIGNLGPDSFDLLVNHQIVHHFKLPDPRTSVHNRDNWLFDLHYPASPPSSPSTVDIYEVPNNANAEEDPATPPGYHDLPDPWEQEATSAETVPQAPETTPPPPVVTLDSLHAAITDMRGELTSLRVDFITFMDLVTDQLDYMHQHLFPPPRG